MTYEESAQLMTDGTFRGRCKVAVIKFADSIMNQTGTAAGDNARLRWAQQTFQQPDMTAQTVQPPTVMDAAVQSAGKNVTDEALQGAVESVVNKML
jgi:hypothetical protein